MNFEIEIRKFDKFKDCNFTKRLTTFPFAHRWVCDHCGIELYYRPIPIKNALDIFKCYEHDEEV